MMRPVPPSDPQALRRHQARYLLASRSALVAGVFTLLVAALLALNFAQRQSTDPLEHPELAALKVRLAAEPRSSALKTQIRQLDQELRAEYFRYQSRAHAGAWLLLGGAVVFLVSIFGMTTLHPSAPQPLRGLERDARQWSEPRRARWAVGLLGAAVIGGLALIAVLVSAPALPDSSDAAAGAVAASGQASPEAPIDETAIARNWPRFRGPDGSGRAADGGIPATWDVSSGENVLWKSPIPLPGVGSPIVWENLVVVTGAEKDQRAVYGLDAATGKLLWTGRGERIAESPAEAPEVMEDTGFAAPTPATDGQRVYAIFANGDLIAFTLKGQRVWARALGMPANGYGHAASLLVWKDLLLVPWDQSENGRLFALDAATGKTVWEEPREVHCSWTTPVVAKLAGGDALITAAAPKVIAYGLPKGEETWSVEGLEGELGSSPVWDGQHVFAVGTDSNLLAIEPGAHGSARVAWKTDKDLPDITSPLSDGERLWLLTTQGRVTCLAAKDGTEFYGQELDASFFASPTLVGERVLLISASGKAFWLASGAEYRLLGTAEFGEKVHASPALAGGRLFVRGERHLFCIAPRGGPKP